MYNMILSAFFYLLRLLEILIIIRVFLSWIPMRSENQLIRLVYQITEPILSPIRNLLSRSALGRGMMFDFSPIIAILLIYVLESIIRRLMYYGVYIR